MIDQNGSNSDGQSSISAPLIGITGPCGAGKTTLAEGLKRNGFRARAIAQEHSYVPAMWQMLTKPDLLIFLQASHPVGGGRRNMSWTPAEWEEQQRRLAHAHAHADLILDTDHISIEQVLETVINFMRSVERFSENPRNPRQ